MHAKPALLIPLLLSASLWLSMKPDLAANAPPALPDEVLRDATLVFRRAMDTPSTAIPAITMTNAVGLAIIPGARADGDTYFGFGVVSARQDNSDRWTAPTIIAFRGTIPIDLDEASLNFILVARTQRGLDVLTQLRPELMDIPIPAGALEDDDVMDGTDDVTGYVSFDQYFGGIRIDRWTSFSINTRNPLMYSLAAAREWQDAIAAYFNRTS